MIGNIGFSYETTVRPERERRVIQCMLGGSSQITFRTDDVHHLSALFRRQEHLSRGSTVPSTFCCAACLLCAYWQVPVWSDDELTWNLALSRSFSTIASALSNALT